MIGLLTILGYSLYDTVVVFDKVRENTAGLLGSGREHLQPGRQPGAQPDPGPVHQHLGHRAAAGGRDPVHRRGLLGAGELKDLALVLFVGMLSGTYSSICIATPVLADLKEREPQYKALAKRVSQRAARRARRQARGRQGGEPGTARPQARHRGSGLDDGGPDEGPGRPGRRRGGRRRGAGAAAAGEPVPAGRTSSRGGTPGGQRPGPRQQPRRTSAARRRPSGKKKRR